ncbi:MAG TPA: hypothetical protein VF905_07965 [Nitrospirota bacterium]
MMRLSAGVRVLLGISAIGSFKTLLPLTMLGKASLAISLFRAVCSRSPGFGSLRPEMFLYSLLDLHEAVGTIGVRQEKLSRMYLMGFSIRP